jgi:hypothetical protein
MLRFGVVLPSVKGACGLSKTMRGVAGVDDEPPEKMDEMSGRMKNRRIGSRPSKV